jgi:hypothetical protein
MATIVQHRETGINYVLLGSGFGAYQSKKPNWLFGDMVADVDQGQHAMICVCDKAGQIGWLESSSVLVVGIDGHPVSNFLH